MHILIGALVGAAFALALVAGAALLTRKKPTLTQVLLAGLGGAVAGAVCSATLGASGLLGATTARQVVAFGVGGASGGSAEQVADNLVEGRDVGEGVLRSAGVGAATGVVSLGTLRGTRHVLTRVAPALVSTNGGGNLATRLLTAPVPGTGTGLLRALEEEPSEDSEDLLPPALLEGPSPLEEPEPPVPLQGGMISAFGF